VIGAALRRREDDRDEVVRRRLVLYRTHAESLRTHYAEMSDNRPHHLRVDGTGEPREVFEGIIGAHNRQNYRASYND
jgi:adenylate kinase family enzyme